MKTVLYIRSDLCNTPLIAGGSVTHTLGVINGFLDHEWQVIVAASVMQDQLKELPVKKMISLSNPRWLSWLRLRINCILSNLFFLEPLLRECSQEKSSYIYQRYNLFNCVGVLVKWCTGIPLILEYNGSEVWIDKYWTKRRWFSFSWLAQKIEQYNLRWAYRIVVVSQALRDELIARGVDTKKIITVPNGVDTNLYNPAQLADARDRIRMQLDIDEQTVFGFVGTFSVWHGITIIADMIPAVCAQSSRAHFLLIGDGPLKKELEERVRELGLQNRVTFTGLLSSHEARDYLAVCDIFLCPTQPNADGSRFFGSPTKLFEYLSLGKPIIASRLEQVAEIMDGKEPMGILVEPHDIQGFINAACRLLEQDRTKMGHAARERACTQYTWKSRVGTIIKQVDQ